MFESSIRTLRERPVSFAITYAEEVVHSWEILIRSWFVRLAFGSVVPFASNHNTLHLPVHIWFPGRKPVIPVVRSLQVEESESVNRLKMVKRVERWKQVIHNTARATVIESGKNHTTAAPKGLPRFRLAKTVSIILFVTCLFLRTAWEREVPGCGACQGCLDLASFKDQFAPV